MNTVTMYPVPTCPYCKKAEDLLTQLGVSQIRKLDVGADSAQLQTMMARTQKRTVPQIYIDETYVGGYDELERLYQAGILQQLLVGGRGTID